MSVEQRVAEVVPRPEYPRPQMVRGEWLNLNGEWEFEIDHGNSGKDRGLMQADRLEGRIIVPFCPESRLSGVHHKDFMTSVWYRRTVEIPDHWGGGCVLLHFGAVDYEAEIWVNGRSAGTHRGGYTSFSFDITSLLRVGANVITVHARDDTRSRRQPKGKQSIRYHSFECEYTRTTGIWQTVWLERVPQRYISDFRVIPDPGNACVHLEAECRGIGSAARLLSVEAYFDGKQVGSGQVVVTGQMARMTLHLTEAHLWEPGNPALYDLKLRLSGDGEEADEIDSYFGLRTVTWDDTVIRVNGAPVFQRLVLDQGYYPDGVYTAPTDDELRRDIELAMEMGFNGARAHQKVFEARYLYWADRLGFLVWGEHAHTGLSIADATGVEVFLPEWMEAMKRDFNSPALVGWCPFNETEPWNNPERQDEEVLRIVYRVSKMFDPTRPVIDTSGYIHVVTDIYDIHDYEQDPDAFRRKFAPMITGGEVHETHPNRQKYGGQPYFVSEYGGIWWNPGQQSDDKGWGYGNRPQSEEEFLIRYEGLTKVLLEHPRICGFCYTQLYDIEQEVNGLYTFERKAKFDPARIRAVNRTRAAIEEPMVESD